MSLGERAQYAKRILAILKERGMTKADLSRKTGISQESIRKWARGINAPSLENLQKVADKLHVDISELVGDPKQATRTANEEAIESFLNTEFGRALDAEQQESLRQSIHYLPYRHRAITEFELHLFADILKTKKRLDEVTPKNRPA